MKHFNSTLFGLLLCVCGQAMALPADHPANPEAAVPAFRPVDYFAQPSVLAAAEAEHQHDQAAVPAATEAGDKQDESAGHQHGQPAASGDVAPEEAAAAPERKDEKSCKRGEGCCCCCKCCDRDKGEAKPADKEGCGMMKKDMMKKGMMMDKEKSSAAKKPAAKKGEGHEAHH